MPCIPTYGFWSLLILLALCSESALAQIPVTVRWEAVSSTVQEGGPISAKLLLSRRTESGRSVEVTVSSGDLPLPTYNATVVFASQDSVSSFTITTLNDTLCVTGEFVLQIGSINNVADSVDQEHSIHRATVSDNDWLVSVDLTGPTAICLGDTVEVLVTTTQNGANPSLGWPPGWTPTWTGDGSETISGPVNGRFDFTPGNAGGYSFQLTLTNGDCMVSDSIDINVVAPVEASAEFVGGVNAICKDGEVSVEAELPGGWSGVWSVIPEGAGDFADTLLASTLFTHAGEGSEVTLTWLVMDNLAVCPNDTVGLPLIIVQPPFAEISPEVLTDYCEGNSYELSASEPGNEQTGEWRIAPDIWGSIADSTDFGTTFEARTSGIYELIWTVSDITEHCLSSSDRLSIRIHHRPNAGSDASLILCTEDSTVNLFDRLGGTPDTGGTWRGPDSDTTGMFNPALMPPGEYTHTYVVSGEAACPSATAQVIVTTAPTPATVTRDQIFSIEGDQFCAGQYTALEVMNGEGFIYTWNCMGCVGGGLTGSSVQLQWGNEAGPWSYSVFTSIGNCRSDTLVVEVDIVAGQASCPVGIVYVEPHGLAILDPLADRFQWGQMQDGVFVNEPQATAQTIFDPANIRGCMPYYAVRTSRGGGCWTTTTTCLDDTPPRNCDEAGGDMTDAVFKLSVSPNPVQDGRIQLLVDGVEPGGELTVELFTAGGQLVLRSGRRAESVMVLELPSGPPPGLYLLRVYGGGVSRSSKITIN